MKKFVVNVSDYMGEEPHMYSLEADNLKEAILFGIHDASSGDLEEWYDTHDIDHIDEAAVIKDLQEQAYDGAPAITIFDVDEDRQVV